MAALREEIKSSLKGMAPDLRKAFAIGWLLAACFVMPAVAAPVLPDARPVIRVADDASYPPYIFVNSAGTPAGFEIDLFQLIEQDTGLKFEWTLTEFSKAVTLLRNREVAIIPGMNVSEQRRSEFAFSRPYLQDKAMLFVPADSFHINRIEDLAGRRLGVQQGEISEQFVSEKHKDLNVYLFSSQRELLLALADRKIDAAISNYYSGHYFLYQLHLDGKVKAIGDELFSHSFAVAARKDEPALLSAIDASLAKLQANGKIDALREKWFGRQHTLFGLSREKLRYYLVSAIIGVGVLLVAGMLFILLLRKKIAEATAEIEEQRSELQKAYLESLAQNEELLAQDEMLGNQNQLLQEQESRLKERTGVLEALQNITMEVLRIDESNELFVRILNRAAQLTNSEHARLDTWDAERSVFQPRSAIGMGAQAPFIPDRGMAGEVMRSKRTIVVENYSTWPLRNDAPVAARIGAMLGVPLLIHDQVRGLFILAHELNGAAFTEGQIAAVEQLARIAAIVLYNADHHEALRSSEETFRLAVDASNDIIFDWNLATGTIWSSRWEKRLGPFFNDGVLNIRSFDDAVHPEDRATRNFALAAHLQGTTPQYVCEFRLRTEDGEIIWIKSHGKAVRNAAGVPIRMVGAITDITESKLREEHIRTLAYQDALTKLPNRLAFMEKLKAELAGESARGSLLLIDLDNFKVLNDSMGHASGDQLLIELGRRLVEVAGPSHLVARIGGDEFSLLLVGLTDIPEVETLASRLTQAATQPYDIEGQQVFCTVSIGIACYPEDGSDASNLFRDADTALHAAKTGGKNLYRFFTSRMREHIFRRMRIEYGLRQALPNNELFLLYQPIVDTQNHRVVGFEALLRWENAELGSVSPLTFVPVAEETGRIIPIGQWVLREACRFMQQLSQKGFPGLFIAVNISARQIQQDTFVHEIKEILEETGLSPTQLELEITETVLIESFEQNVAKLLTIKKWGVKIALDDFGTGYSSLTYLKHLPIHKLKIDKSFVDNLTEGGPNIAILDAIMQLSRSLGLTVVAEGVETPAQQSALSQHGCVFTQGYLFGKGVSAAEVEKSLAATQS